VSSEPNSSEPGKKVGQSPEQILRQAGPYLTMGIQLAAGIVIFFLIGWWLDTRYETSPTFKLIGLTVGSIGGMVKFIKSAIELGKKEKSP
jgi:F0F1-type ATP synthase assembly protein I